MNPRFKQIAVTLAALATIGLTLSLGQWQLRRAAEKMALQSAIESQGSKSALDAVALRQTSDPLALVHQPTRLRGSWVTDATVFLDNRQMNARVGFFVLTPMLLEGGGAVLVQRGWVPRNFEKRTELPAVHTPQGLVDIAGRIAPPPSKLYEPGTAATGTIRQNLDMDQFRRETGLPLMPVTVLQTGVTGDGLQREWPVINVGVDKHYGYAFQWFAIAVLVVALTLWFQFIRPYYQRSQEPQDHV